MPAWHYPNLWDRAELIVTKRKTDAMNKKSIALETEIADVRRLAHNLASSSQNVTSTAAAAAAVALPKFLEGDSSSKKGGGSQGFRGKGKEKSAFCYVCGSNLHTSSSGSYTPSR
jgi:hypothetical protein